MKTLLIIMMITSVIFTQINHPMTLGLMLLMQTTMVSMFSGMMSQSFWFSYILFLIFIGGMLILFIYVTSIASNELFYMSKVIIITSMIMLSLLLFLKYNKLNVNNQEMMTFMPMNNSSMKPLIKLYNNPTNMMTMMLVMYLFITLIVVVKITNIFKGPLRKMI
nr:NADH dehydrogenase subunit 6 [Allacta transversa]